MMVLTIASSLLSLFSMFLSEENSVLVVCLVFSVVELVVVGVVFGLRRSAHLISPKPTGVEIVTCFFW